MTADTLRDLAARVEGLSGADRRIDVEVWCACTAWGKEEFAKIGDLDRMLLRQAPAPQYTERLDAAFSLIPEYVSFQLDFVAGGSYPGRAYVNDGAYSPGEQWNFKFKAVAKTLALATVAASLRALAALDEGR